jgi:transposase InsO family protein
LASREIFYTDQASPFTSAVFSDTLAASGIWISMDRRGRWVDNVFIERLWRSLKYEDVYLKGYGVGPRGHDRDRRVDRLAITTGGRIRRWRTTPGWRSGATASPARSAKRVHFRS